MYFLFIKKQIFQHDKITQIEFNVIESKNEKTLLKDIFKINENINSLFDKFFENLKIVSVVNKFFLNDNGYNYQIHNIKRIEYHGNLNYDRIMNLNYYKSTLCYNLHRYLNDYIIYNSKMELLKEINIFKNIYSKIKTKYKKEIIENYYFNNNPLFLILQFSENKESNFLIYNFIHNKLFDKNVFGLIKEFI